MSFTPLALMSQPEVTIHTHDRITFKRCKRYWYLASPLGLNLEPTSAEKKLNLWFGSGFHFAMEDYHGYRRFGYPEEAFEAYAAAFEPHELPYKAEESIELGMGMLAYYVKWLKRREEHKTVWLEGKPQVEVGFDLALSKVAEQFGMPVYYHGTFDRIVEDPYSRWLVEDFKTAASIDTVKLSTDPQISAYLWAAPYYFQRPIVGMLYSQYAKSIPREPKVLVKGGFSKDKSQKTSHLIYREALIRQFGQVPKEYIDILNEFASQESVEGDAFIRKDTVLRTDYERAMTERHIEAEACDMIALALEVGDDLTSPRLYPTPNRDCSWECPFRAVCIAMNEGADYEFLLEDSFRQRNRSAEGEEAPWRKRIRWPTVER